MQSILIQFAVRIKVLPKNSNALNRINFKPLDILPVFTDTFEKSGITPFLGLGTFDVGEDGCSALTFGEEVGEDGGFPVAECGDIFVSDRIQPVVVFAEKVAAAVSATCVSGNNRRRRIVLITGKTTGDRECSSHDESGIWGRDVPYNLKILHVLNRFVAL